MHGKLKSARRRPHLFKVWLQVFGGEGLWHAGHVHLERRPGCLGVPAVSSRSILLWRILRASLRRLLRRGFLHVLLP